MRRRTCGRCWWAAPRRRRSCCARRRAPAADRLTYGLHRDLLAGRSSRPTHARHDATADWGAGVPLPGVDVRDHRRGHIEVRGPMLMAGYWDEPPLRAGRVVRHRRPRRARRARLPARPRAARRPHRHRRRERLPGRGRARARSLPRHRGRRRVRRGRRGLGPDGRRGAGRARATPPSDDGAARLRATGSSRRTSGRAQVCYVERLPHTPAGKLDRLALPAVARCAAAAGRAGPAGALNACRRGLHRGIPRTCVGPRGMSSCPACAALPSIDLRSPQGERDDCEHRSPDPALGAAGGPGGDSLRRPVSASARRPSRRRTPAAPTSRADPQDRTGCKREDGVLSLRLRVRNTADKPAEITLLDGPQRRRLLRDRGDQEILRAPRYREVTRSRRSSRAAGSTARDARRRA